MKSQNESAQTFSQPLMRDSRRKSYGGVQAGRNERDVQFGGGAHLRTSFITSRRPSKDSRLHFTPVSFKVLTSLAITVLCIVYVQAQLSLPIWPRASGLTVRVILIPFVLLAWLAYSSYMLGKTAKLHLHNAFLQRQLRYFSRSPYWLHLVTFPCISAFYICHQAFHSSYLFMSLFPEDFPAESTCITFWSLVHFVDLYIIVRLLWSCIAHNYLRDHSSLFTIDPGQLSFIREQRWIISGVSELLLLKNEQLRRLVETPRFPSKQEQDLSTRLALKEEAHSSLHDESVLLKVQMEGLRTTIENKHSEAEKRERDLQIHRTICNHNSSLVSRLEKRRGKLEEENRQKKLFLKISREQIESSRTLHEQLVKS